MLSARILTAVVLIPAVLAALFLLPPPGWGVAAAAAVAAAALEWARLARCAIRGQAALAAATVAICAFLLFAPAAGFGPGGWPAATVLFACGPAALFWLAIAPRWLRADGLPASRGALAVAGVVVLVGAWAAVVHLQARSPWLVLAAMAIVWIADTAAYFAGRAFGRRKLAPSVSPGKTWEGVYGALAGVAAYALALVPAAERAGFAGTPSALVIAAWVLVALALAALSIVGDLVESRLKRAAGVKDSGRLLPGHGGVLDRIDALVAAMPAAAMLAVAFLQ
jgi:phosphatidate cytidylyltransferase